MTFNDLGLSAELLKALEAKNYTVPTPVQAQAIPEILRGRDILAGAQTGTGKTAAFALPMLQMLDATKPENPRASRHPRALILTPTRELADQVAASFRTYGKNLRLRIAVIYGGVGLGPQTSQLRQGVDIVVATPGRLLAHTEMKTINLSSVETFVLDEADRMMDMGFLPDMRRVAKLLPTKRQTLLFSATYSKEIRILAEGFLTRPVEIDVAPRNSTVELIAQVIHPVSASRKRQLLAHLILQGDWKQVLVFTRTKHGANRLAEQLDKDGVSASAIHGNKSQNARIRALSDFKEGKLRVLVATDIASRGLDISLLPHVVNYELPNVPEEYVHRIGRTGRAGMEGTAVSLVSHEESRYLRDIEKLVKRPIESQVIAGFEGETLIPGNGGPAPVREQKGSRGPSRSSAPRRSGNSNNGKSGGSPKSRNWESDSRGNRADKSDRQDRSKARPARPERGDRPEGGAAGYAGKSRRPAAAKNESRGSGRPGTPSSAAGRGRSNRVRSGS